MSNLTRNLAVIVGALSAALVASMLNDKEKYKA